MPDKPYFAKYFPVEGKIGIGDHAKGPDGRIILCTEDNQASIQEHWKKVQLFLCRRPDDVKTNWDEQEWREATRQEKDNYLASSGQLIKIGQLSPHATWVKEGDAFSEEEVKRDVLTKWYAGEDDYTEYAHHYPKVEETVKIPSDEKFISEYPIKLKGPCGHFH